MQGLVWSLTGRWAGGLASPRSLVNDLLGEGVHITACFQGVCIPTFCAEYKTFFFFLVSPHEST